MRHIISLPILLAATAVASFAIADDDTSAASPPAAVHRPLVAEGHLSLFGGPAGLLGVGLDAIPVSAFGITATAGLGGGGGSAIFGLVPRLRLPVGATSYLSLGVGASGGPAFQSGDLAVGSDAPYRRDYKRTGFALWVDALAGYEIELSTHLRLRIYAGAERRVLTTGAVSCYSQNGHETGLTRMACDSPAPFTEPKGPPLFVPVIGGAFGYAFGG